LQDIQLYILPFSRTYHTVCAMKETLVVIPTYNECENVRGIAAAVFAASDDVDILFVDDNSPDGTGKIIKEMGVDDERVHLLHRPAKSGLGRAYIAGFQWALKRGYEFIFEMDADFSHNPADIPRFLAAASDADLVLGSRYIGGIRIINWPLNRLILSKTAGYYVRIITGMPFSDPTGGYKCFRKDVLKSIDLEGIRSNGYSFQVEMTHNAWMKGYRIVDVPITFEERRSGQSKMSSDIIFEAFGMVWKLFFKCGLRRKPPRKARS